MSTWNHRIIKKELRRDNTVEETYYEVHEVHYNAKSEICAITESSVAGFGETVAELEQVLQRMLAACKKPILVQGEIEFASWDDNEDKEP